LKFTKLIIFALLSLSQYSHSETLSCVIENINAISNSGIVVAQKGSDSPLIAQAGTKFIVDLKTGKITGKNIPYLEGGVPKIINTGVGSNAYSSLLYFGSLPEQRVAHFRLSLFDGSNNFVYIDQYFIVYGGKCSEI